MEKVTNKKSIIISCLIVLIILFSTVFYINYKNYKQHYFPMQKYEVSFLTNVVYKLSDVNKTRDQRINIIYGIMEQRGNTQFENNVVDVVESHQDQYGYFGEDDILKPKYVDKIRYVLAQNAVEQMIKDKKVSILN